LCAINSQQKIILVSLGGRACVRATLTHDHVTPDVTRDGKSERAVQSVMAAGVHVTSPPHADTNSPYISKTCMYDIVCIRHDCP